MTKEIRKCKNKQPLSPSIRSVHSELPKKIIWPLWEYAQNGKSSIEKYNEIDSYTFPGTKAIYSNYQIYDEASGASRNRSNPQGISLGIKEFWDTFRQSKDIIFADPYFAPIHYRRIIFELDKITKRIDGVTNKHIRIYGKNNIALLKSCAENLKKSYPKVYVTYTIGIGKLPSNGIDVHDRFAIMDGEIWHCGAAIGGMYGLLNAVSRGWPDTDDLLMKFFIDKGEILIVYK